MTIVPRQREEPGRARRVVCISPAAPAARRRRSAGAGGTSRRSGRGRSLTSQAATTITISAKIWPSPLPCMRAKATSARLAALSISSRQSRITSGLRRDEHAAGADRRRSARETTRYQLDAHRHSAGAAGRRPRAESGSAGPRRPADASAIVPMPAAADVHRPRRVGVGSPRPPRRRARMTAPTAAISSRNEATSKAQQELRQQQLADLRRACRSPRRTAGALGVERLQAGAEHRDQQLDEQRAARTASPATRRPRPTGGRERLARAADVGDDEDVEHHHRAGVDDDLRGGDELARSSRNSAASDSRWTDEREHASRTGCAARPSPTAPAIAPIAGDEEEDLGHAATERYSPSRRSGVRSSGSASSISLVKMRSERL